MDGAFRNRADAGRQLAARLAQLELHDPLVLGIPRGGVSLAAAIARELDGETDIVLSRKLPAPHQPELAVGAVSESGEVFLTPDGRHVPGVTEEYIQRERDRQMAEIERRRAMFRAVRPAAPMKGRTVIVTDDGIATGSTMIAALQGARLHEPAELIAAVPVAPPDAATLIEPHCDRYVCLASPPMFFAISQFYENFEQVDDEEVMRVLKDAGSRLTR